MDDEQIVSLYWLRKESAIRETEKKYDRYLTKIAYNILSDYEDSRESVNDTYLAAWNSMPPHRPGVLSTYLGKITRRISIDRFRYRTRKKKCRRKGFYREKLEAVPIHHQAADFIQDVLMLRKSVAKRSRKC